MKVVTLLVTGSEDAVDPCCSRCTQVFLWITTLKKHSDVNLLLLSGKNKMINARLLLWSNYSTMASIWQHPITMILK